MNAESCKAAILELEDAVQNGEICVFDVVKHIPAYDADKVLKSWYWDKEEISHRVWSRNLREITGGSNNHKLFIPSVFTLTLPWPHYKKLKELIYGVLDWLDVIGKEDLNGTEGNRKTNSTV